MFVLGLCLAVCIGVAVGLVGGGGSILTVPVLHYVIGLPAHEAVASSLAIVGITSTAALAQYARRGNVKWRTGLLFGTASMSGAYGAARIAHHVPAPVLLIAFGLVLLAAARSMLRTGDREVRSTPMSPQIAIALGVAVGAVAGLVGTGGGFLIVPALISIGRFPVRDAIGTTLLIIVMNTSAGFVGAQHGTVIDPKLILSFAAVAVVGSLVAATFAQRVATTWLRATLGWMCVAIGAFVLVKEGPTAFGFELDPDYLWAWMIGGAAVVAITATIMIANRRRASAEQSR